MTPQEQILARKQARAVAAEVAELIEGEVRSMTAEARAAFFEDLARRLPIPRQAAPPINCEPFTDAQARAWGKQRMRFGIHEGQRIDDIPISYLEKLADPSDFTRSLRRYLASHRLACEEEARSQEKN